MKVPTPRRLESGTWFIQLRLNGVSVPVTGATAKECIRAAELIKAEHNAGKRKIIRKNTMLLKDACLNYVDEHNGRLSPSTAQGYMKIVRNQLPGLMSMRICDINSNVIKRAVAEECKRKNARGENYSPKSVREAYAFAAMILRENKVEFDTPPLPEIKRKPVQILTADQVYSAVKGTEIELSCLLAMWLSFSISEIRGLTKSKSIRNNQISVIETVIDIGGKPITKAGGKEETRTRTRNIPPYIMQLINAVDGDVICPLSSQATNKRLQRLLEKHGLPRISFHKLRHIYASTGAALGVPPEYIQDGGGWKSDHIMRTTYTHTFTAERLAADRIYDDFFENLIENAN